jgi:hypothetical protein
MGFKATSSVVTISNRTTESAANTFTQTEVDLQLSPLDNEIFVILAIDVSPQPPDAVGGADTSTTASVSSTSRLTVGTIGDNNVLGFGESAIRGAGYIDSGVGFQQFSGETPTANLDYIGILATNNFFVQLQGANNAVAKVSSVRLWGYRAKADSATYAALVQSEVLSS